MHEATVSFSSLLKAQLTGRYLIFQWVCGVVCAVVTTLNIIIQTLRGFKSPIWVGVLGNFSFVSFVYMYMLGIIIQDYDAGYSVPLITLHAMLTVLFQPFASFLECISVIYGIVMVPCDFEVIRK